MLKVVLCLVGLVVMVAGDCSVIERQVVKSQWAKAYGVGNERESFGESVWERIFELEPAARAIFGRVNGDNIYSSEFRAHALRVLGGFDMCVGLLDDNEALKAQLAHLQAQHVERKIPDNYFVALKTATLEVLHDRIGHCFHYEAWNHCLEALNEGIKG
jgi:hemoglobin-like flavoprotein